MRGRAYLLSILTAFIWGIAPIFGKGDDVNFFDRFITGIWI